jgi:hypothetical protein
LPEAICTIREADRRIEIANGGFIEVRSAHVEGQLRAETLDFAIIDEAAFMVIERWTRELRPTLAIKQGEALFLSSFDGENWFYDLYLRGLDEKYPDWQSWRHPSIDNPFMDEQEIEEARRTTPRAEFEQEYLANPMIYRGAVFDGELVQDAIDRGVNARFVPEPECDHWIGIDWGYTNPTVVLVAQEHPSGGNIEWIGEHTWHAMRLEERLARICAIVKGNQVRAIYADNAGKDENISLAAKIDDMVRDGDEVMRSLDCGVVGVPFSQYKDSGIKTRRWYIEQGLESIGPECKELARSTKSYRYKEDTEIPEKVDDHHVDAATAFYSSRRYVVVGE